MKENDEAEARQKAREKELRARKETDEKVYGITLKQVDLPGLPPATQKTNSVAMKNSTRGDALETNAVAAVASSTGVVADLDGELEGDEKPPLVDANLNEAERIMLDYLALLPKSSPMLATQIEAGH